MRVGVNMLDVRHIRYNRHFLYKLPHKGMICAKMGDEQAARQILYEALSLNANFHPIYAAQAVAEINELGAHRIATQQAAFRR